MRPSAETANLFNEQFAAFVSSTEQGRIVQFAGPPSATPMSTGRCDFNGNLRLGFSN
jgi:hypothetical protein